MSEAQLSQGINRVEDIAAASDFENKQTHFIECERGESDSTFTDCGLGR